MVNPGRYLSANMTMAEYQAEKSASAGLVIDIINECPKRAFINSAFNPDFVPEKPRKEFDIGTALHFAVLEPSLFAKRVHVIDTLRYATNAAKQERDEARAAGKIPLKSMEADIVHGMRGALLRHPLARKLIEGEVETSLFWDWDGISCKCRPDMLTDSGETIVDLKTAASANPRKISAKAWNEGWHIRDPWYREGVRVVYGVEPKHYVYLVVEKDPPHIIQPYEIDARALAWGELAIRRGLERFRACMEAGEWPGYGEGIAELSLPAWSEFQMAEREQEWQE